MLEENTTCSKCNKPNPAGYQYCLNCGASLYPGEAPTANVLDSDSQQRPGCVTLYAIVLGIGATFSAFIGLMTPFATETASTPPFSERALVLGYFWGSAVVLFILAWGLLRFKEWARVGVILVVVIALLFSLFIAAMAGNLGRIVIQLAIAGYIIHWFGSNDRYFENGDFDQFIKETRWLIATGVISYLVLLGLYPVIQTTRHQIQSQQATATVETVQARATTKAAQATANVQALLATTRFGNEIEGAAYHPNGSQILIVEAHTPEVFDAKTLEKVATLRRHTTWVTGADYSPDGLTVVTADLDCTAKVWDAHYHELTTLTHHTTTTRKGGFTPTGQQTVDFSPDGQKVTACGAVWDTSTYAQLFIFSDPANDLRSVAFNPDGRNLAVAAQGQVHIWNVDTGEQIISLEISSEARSVAYSPDGHSIVVGKKDGSVEIWSTANWSRQSIWKASEDERSAINNSIYSPDRSRILTAGGDRTAKMWDAVTVQNVVTIKQWGNLRFALYSPDGSRVLTVSFNELVLWDAHVLQRGGIFSSYNE